MLDYNYNKYTTCNYALAKYKNLQYKKKYLSKSTVQSKHWNFVKSTLPVHCPSKMYSAVLSISEYLYCRTFGLGSIGLLRLYCTIHKCPDQGNKERKVNFCCVFSAYILKPVLTGRCL